MNRYGQQAWNHWQKWFPTELAKIGTKEQQAAHFEEIGRQAVKQIEGLRNEIAGVDQPGETFQEKWGRLGAARAMAEEQVVRELVLPDPNPDPDLQPTPENSRQAPPPYEWESDAEAPDQPENPAAR